MHGSKIRKIGYLEDNFLQTVGIIFFILGLQWPDYT